MPKIVTLSKTLPNELVSQLKRYFDVTPLTEQADVEKVARGEEITLDGAELPTLLTPDLIIVVAEPDDPTWDVPAMIRKIRLISHMLMVGCSVDANDEQKVHRAGAQFHLFTENDPYLLRSYVEMFLANMR